MKVPEQSVQIKDLKREIDELKKEVWELKQKNSSQSKQYQELLAEEIENSGLWMYKFHDLFDGVSN